ncbi:MAG TPA: CCA tRNA nucleotidyltransferase [Lachnospiraceae bacterium]|nr:CCA tRNA nucleotidyltransferase [Lachnospiraceae bacterium]
MNKFDIQVPDDVQDIIKRINDAGYEAYVVGGCVRDSLLNIVPDDWDITTSAQPEEIKAIFKRTVDTGLVHGTVTVLYHGEGYEVTTYRLDGEYEDGRHPKEVTFTASLEEDLKRRDFTINAMAYHPEKGLVDLFNGIDDLNNHIIRAVGDPVKRFSEDALRMMRAIRFAARFDFEIENETYLAIKELAPTLSKISAERIQTEMVKLLVSDHPDYFRMFYDTGLTKVFMPEFDKAMETAQNHPHHMYSVGEHILHSLLYVPADKCLRLGMLFHDLGKPAALTVDEDGITHFHGHQELSAKMSKDILRRLKFDNDTIDRVYNFSLYHDRKIEHSEKAMRRALNKIGEKNFPYLFDIKYADTMAQSNYLREEKLEDIKALREIYASVMEKRQAYKISDLAVDGKALINEGIQPGKQIGEILSNMLEDVIEEPAHNDKEYLLNTYVRKAANLLLLLLCLIITTCSLTACSLGPKDNKTVSAPSTGFVPATPGNYDSEDKAVIVAINEETGTITFQTTYTGKKYTLNYDGATIFLDKYDQGMSLKQLKPGDLVVDRFMKDRKRLDNLKLMDGTFAFNATTDYELDENGKALYISGNKYTFSKDLVVIGSEGLGTLMDVNAIDAITVKGIDHEIKSIYIDRSHGYLRLTNDTYFIGGWIEVNKNQICKIESDMILTVPVGTYDVTVSNQGCQGTEKITVAENEEVELDVSKWEGETKYGKILFVLSPTDAKVYIDGSVVDTTTAVELQYGIHQMIVIRDGYQTISRYIKVQSDSSSLDVTMEAKESVSDNDADKQTVSDNSLSANSVSSNAVSNNSANNNTNISNSSNNNGSSTTNNSQNNNNSDEKASSISTNSANSSKDVISTGGDYKVYIDSPSGVEVYVDGSYAGIAPVSFAKKSGQIVVTLRKDGYKTRSYTLTIDDANRDSSYSFSALVPTS